MPFTRRESFMQPEITGKIPGFRVETKQGTTFLPSEVGGVNLCYSVELCSDSRKDCQGCQDAFQVLGQYVEGGPDAIESAEEVVGYFGRYQAPGYLDSTDWSFDTNRARLEKHLREMYGDE